MIHRITFSNGAFKQFENGMNSTYFDQRDCINIAAFMKVTGSHIVSVESFEHLGELPGHTK